jgi:hypothetical protein
VSHPTDMSDVSPQLAGEIERTLVDAYVLSGPIREVVRLEAVGWDARRVVTRLRIRHVLERHEWLRSVYLVLKRLVHLH